MDVKIEKSWKEVLAPEFEKSYFQVLTSFIRGEYKTKTVYPPPGEIFEAFNRTPFENVNVVVLGQDPYHGESQAHGLCFSVKHGVRTPPSLQNIYKEIHADTGDKIPPDGNLEHWADKGVLLLNATLTVEAHKAGSHQHKGWEEFTDAVVHALAENKEHLVFLLWGSYAQKKGAFIDREKHLVLEAPHPSPFSAYSGFFGCKHFSQTNAYLFAHAKNMIEWAREK